MSVHCDKHMEHLDKLSVYNVESLEFKLAVHAVP